MQSLAKESGFPRRVPQIHGHQTGRRAKKPKLLVFQPLLADAANPNIPGPGQGYLQAAKIAPSNREQKT